MGGSKSSIRLSLLGLPPLEHALLSAVLAPNFRLVSDWRDAELIVLSAEETSLVRKLRSRDLKATVLLVGEQASGTGWAILPRPIDAAAVMEVVSLLSLRPALVISPPVHASDSGQNSELRELQPVALPPPPAAASSTAGHYQHTVLLVGGTRLLHCTLTKVLRKFGYGVEFAHDLRTAKTLLQSRYYYVVMLDATSLGRKTVPACLLLRRVVRQPQRMVVLSSHGGVQQLLGNLIGCDAWMVKPLRRKQLKYYLRNHAVPTYQNP